MLCNNTKIEKNDPNGVDALILEGNEAGGHIGPDLLMF